MRNMVCVMADAATSAVMIFLSCSPDMLLCRASASPSVIYPTLVECDAALKVILAESGRAKLTTVGRCDLVSKDVEARRWGISPNGELFSATADDISTLAKERDGEPTSPQVPVTVRVTRRSGLTTETTEYSVIGTSAE
jgi:hypothetical protein